MTEIKRVAITTGGGDAPGLNAVIRSIVLSACNRSWECVGIREGYNGLLEPERFAEGGLMALDRAAVRGITHLGARFWAPPTGGIRCATRWRTGRGGPLRRSL